MKIYVGNLSYLITEDQLEDTFSDFGEVQSVKLVHDQESGKSKGFGFVEMPDVDGEDAIQALDESTLSGRNIKVSKAKVRGNKRRQNSGR
ncbi:MAG: RNA-binding protein [Gammaproteobacteria bacterium]|nr:RNA-binding protein [Gammaproteobacteria bacterium]